MLVHLVTDETGGVLNTKNPRPVRIAFDDDFLVLATGFDGDWFWLRHYRDVE